VIFSPRDHALRETKEIRVRRILIALGIGLVGLFVQSGCQSSNTPAPAPARVPTVNERVMEGSINESKPLPPQGREDLPPPPFDDVPLVNQEAPETQRYVTAYNQVGHPRILVWVQQPGAGQYDEAAARSIDYAAMENILTDWLSAGGRVAVISPQAARQSLDPNQMRDLNSGQPARPQEISDRLHADVLVLVQAQPTRQSGVGPAVRLVAEATNLRGAESLGQAVVDVLPPLDKPQINKYTRFVARKLMDGMTANWSSFGAPQSFPPGPAEQPGAGSPSTQPSAPATNPNQ
jgi:hypothetical protein